MQRAHDSAFGFAPIDRGLRVALIVALPFVVHAAAGSAELEPGRVLHSAGGDRPPVGTFSGRTLVVGLEVDRDASRLLAYTVKRRPYAVPLDLAPARPHDATPTAQLEVVLSGPGGLRHTRRIDAGPLCLTHAGAATPHIAGDTIRVHRDSLVVELPELEGFDRIEVAYFESRRGSTTRRSLGIERLDAARFTAAGGPLAFSDLALAPGSDPTPTPPAPAGADPLWPEDFGDPELYQVFGDLGEGDRRINIVIVPDGYRYADKALMEAHANAMVTHFRSKTPYAEHDPFINYILVYAYSVESGTDQCDCAIVRNTAMGTRFPQSNPQCGHSDNRCLYYGGGCDTNGVANVVAAELRAPYHDETVVMVNTGRYGGCGGSRAVYSAAASSAVEIAVHELGHSLGGLADEYAYDPGCGVFAGEINTSLDPIEGAWPEWIDDLGPPRQGGQYYQQCIYRPITSCEMRSLNQPFCPVCNQRWSLITFGHPRVAPTAPIASQSPDPVVSAWAGVPVDFSVATRLSAGDHVSNRFTWELETPLGDSQVVGTGSPAHTWSFARAGLYTLSVEVIADANFVKRSRDGANVDVATWLVDVAPLVAPPEVSGPGSAEPLRFLDEQRLTWEDASEAGAFSYNLYRGDVADLGGETYGACLEPDLEANTAEDSGSPPASTSWLYLVAGANPAGEGPLGRTSAGEPRTSAAPCE